MEEIWVKHLRCIRPNKDYSLINYQQSRVGQISFIKKYEQILKNANVFLCVLDLARAQMEQLRVPTAHGMEEFELSQREQESKKLIESKCMYELPHNSSKFSDIHSSSTYSNLLCLPTFLSPHLTYQNPSTVPDPPHQ